MLTPKNMIDLKEQLVLLLCNYQQELYDKFKNEIEFSVKDRSRINNYAWRTPELWEKYAMAISQAVSEHVKINSQTDYKKNCVHRFSKIVNNYYCDYCNLKREVML